MITLEIDLEGKISPPREMTVIMEVDSPSGVVLFQNNAETLTLSIPEIDNLDPMRNIIRKSVQKRIGALAESLGATLEIRHDAGIGYRSEFYKHVKATREQL